MCELNKSLEYIFHLKYFSSVYFSYEVIFPVNALTCTIYTLFSQNVLQIKIVYLRRIDELGHSVMG